MPVTLHVTRVTGHSISSLSALDTILRFQSISSNTQSAVKTFKVTKWLDNVVTTIYK